MHGYVDADCDAAQPGNRCLRARVLKFTLEIKQTKQVLILIYSILSCHQFVTSISAKLQGQETKQLCNQPLASC